MPRAVTKGLGNRNSGVVVENRLRHAAEGVNGRDVTIQKRLGPLRRISFHKTGVGIGKIKAEEMDLALDTADDPDGFAEVDLGMTRRMQQRHEHLTDTYASTAHIVLHRRIAAIKTMLVTKAIVNPLRRVMLLTMDL